MPQRHRIGDRFLDDEVQRLWRERTRLERWIHRLEISVGGGGGVTTVGTPALAAEAIEAKYAETWLRADPGFWVPKGPTGGHWEPSEWVELNLAAPLAEYSVVEIYAVTLTRLPPWDRWTVWIGDSGADPEGGGWPPGTLNPQAYATIRVLPRDGWRCIVSYRTYWRFLRSAAGISLYHQSTWDPGRQQARPTIHVLMNYVEGLRQAP